MIKSLAILVLLLIATLLLVSACKNDDPTGPDNNNVVTDPDPPDYSTFVSAYFRVEVMATQQYDTFSTDEVSTFSPTGNLLGSFSGQVFTAETTYTIFDGEYTELLTIAVDTLTGVMSNLEYHQTYNDPVSSYEMSVLVSDLERSTKTPYYIVFVDSSTSVCSHINDIDYDYENIPNPNSSYSVTSYSCEEWSIAEITLMTYTY